MAISGRISDLKLLISLFGNVTIKEILHLKETFKILSKSELAQLKLNIETSVGDSTPTEAEYGSPLPLEDVGVSRLDEDKIA